MASGMKNYGKTQIFMDLCPIQGAIKSNIPFKITKQ